mmetsp:Transcript_10878/g.27182  ORF Transcript_10878/g.27182 Transcript_10878/m.27182 type:complete len:137 (-) Transcript_10878:294-704(-)
MSRCAACYGTGFTESGGCSGACYPECWSDCPPYTRATCTSCEGTGRVHHVLVTCHVGLAKGEEALVCTSMSGEEVASFGRRVGEETATEFSRRLTAAAVRELLSTTLGLFDSEQIQLLCGEAQWNSGPCPVALEAA